MTWLAFQVLSYLTFGLFLATCFRIRGTLLFCHYDEKLDAGLVVLLWPALVVMGTVVGIACGLCWCVRVIGKVVCKLGEWLLDITKDAT